MALKTFIRSIPIMLAVALTPSASAAQQLGAYYAEISTADMHNSSGARLTDFGAILQQDRANVHRFGIRQDGDDIDPFFGDRAMRAVIPDLYRRGARDTLIESIVLGGDPLGIIVFVCGAGGAIGYISVDFADGDGYRGC